MNRSDQLEHLLEYFQPDKLLDEIVQSMSNVEFEETYDWICRMWDIPSTEG